MTGISGREAAGSSARGAKRWALVVLLVIGIGLALAPVAFKMFERGPKGAQMMDEFRPFMKDARLNGFQQDIRDIDAAVHQANGRVVVRLEGHGAAAHKRFDTRFPGFAQFAGDWPPINEDMSGLMSLIKANAGNYRAVAALPSFRIFPWFFVVPGAIIALLALAGLLAPRARPLLRWGFVVLGVGLVLAPVAFGMFGRAPQGGRMMTAFKTIETRQKVETIQGYFATIAVGQGALRLDIVPALRRSGLSTKDIATRYAAVDTLDRRWIPILNDMTPMIGAMSDNVDNYDAIKSLPPFPLFPWFFVIPGLLIVALALLPGARRDRPAARSAVAAPLPTPSQGGAL
jgi:hypothetical protein